MAKKSVATRLDAAREAHVATIEEIADLEARRNAALIADDDATAAKLFADLEALRAVVHGHTDKIALLEAEAQRERAEAIVRGHQALIGRFEKKLADSDADLTEAADLIGQAWKKITSGIDKREAALAAFNVHSSHARAAATSVNGCAMSAEAVMHLLSFHFYKISAKPLLGGRPGERTRPPLPGSKCPRLEWQLQPERIQPFSEKMRGASAFAVETLKAEIGNSGEVAAPVDEQPPPTSAAPTNGFGPLLSAAEAQRAVLAEVDARDRALAKNTVAPSNGNSTSNTAGAPAEQPERTPEQQTYSDLLQEANKLARDVTEEGERKYRAIMAQIPAAEAAANASIEKGN
jgi:hypothetical protein